MMLRPPKSNDGLAKAGYAMRLAAIVTLPALQIPLWWLSFRAGHFGSAANLALDFRWLLHLPAVYLGVVWPFRVLLKNDRPERHWVWRMQLSAFFGAFASLFFIDYSRTIDEIVAVEAEAIVPRAAPIERAVEEYQEVRKALPPDLWSLNGYGLKSMPSPDFRPNARFGYVLRNIDRPADYAFLRAPMRDYYLYRRYRGPGPTRDEVRKSVEVCREGCRHIGKWHLVRGSEYVPFVDDIGFYGE